MSGWKMVEEQEERDDIKLLEVLHISNLNGESNETMYKRMGNG